MSMESPKEMITGNLRSRGFREPDDYGSMKEVLTRRFTHGLEERRNYQAQSEGSGRFTKFPDLLLMDGGKGQGECSTGSVIRASPEHSGLWYGKG